jgi:hypothetical protein
MLEANPQLTPDDVVTLLRQTANPMPYEQKVVGSGYVDAHNAVRAAMGLSMVAHPANLFPPPPSTGGPQIIDPAGDQFGTDAQDLLSGEYKYDATANQIVFTLTMTDLSTTTPNMHWIQELTFKDPNNPAAPATLLYVTTAIDDPVSGPTFSYGTIANQNGVNLQTDLGATDSGQIVGNKIIIRLSVDKVNAAVGYSVVGTTATSTQAIAQVVIGAGGSGLLFPADAATGSDFIIQP